jgi:predicted O-methyltransferase YrrM
MNKPKVSFDELWETIQAWGGWLREDQALALWKAAIQIEEDGVVVEIGSYRGKSASVLLVGTRDSNEVFAIDPHGGTDRSLVSGSPQKISAKRIMKFFFTT